MPDEKDPLLDEFLAEVTHRRDSKRPAKPAPDTAQEVDPNTKAETNLFNASVGTRFKCGVCGKTHRSSKLEMLKSLRPCIVRLVSNLASHLPWSPMYQQAGRKSKYSAGRLAVIPTELRLNYRTENILDNVIPDNVLWVATHKKFIREVQDVKEEINNTLVRSTGERVSIAEILGAPDSAKYAKGMFEDFRKRAPAAMSEIMKAQREKAAPILERLKKPWDIALNKWKIEKKYEDRESTKWVKHPGEKALTGIVLNGTHDIASDTILESFETIYEENLVWTSYGHSKEEKRVLDVDLFNGLPAMLWSIVMKRGMPKSRKVQAEIRFLSTWDRSVYLIADTGDICAVADAMDHQRHLLKLVIKDQS